MNSKQPGILLGKMLDLYSIISSELSGEKFSIVGIYYFEDNSMNALIYRIFDGTVYPFLSHEINFDILSTHQLVDSMYVYQFNQESWLLDGNKDSLNNKIKSSIHQCLIDNISMPDYNSLVLNITGMKTDIVINGYYKINEILLSIVGDDLNKRKTPLHRNILDCKYLNECINIVKEYRKEYNDPSPDVILLDSKKRITELSNIVVNLICENPIYRNHVFNINLNRNVEFTKEIVQVEKPIDIKNELFRLRKLITSLSNSLANGSTPVISIVELIDTYNRLAIKSNEDKFKIEKNIVYDSIGALVIFDSNNLRSNDISISLRSGDTLYIPCTGEGIELLSEDERLEVLRYVLSIRKATNSYNGLLDIMVRECISKSKRS